MRLALVLAALLIVGTAEAKVYRGHLYVGPENEAFYPCGNKTGYWFLASDQVRGHIIEVGLKHSEALSEKGVFVELDGAVGRKTKESDGHASAYPAFFRVKKVMSVRKVESNDCTR